MFTKVFSLAWDVRQNGQIYGLTSPSTYYWSFRRRVFPVNHLHNNHYQMIDYTNYPVTSCHTPPELRTPRCHSAVPRGGTRSHDNHVSRTSWSSKLFTVSCLSIRSTERMRHKLTNSADTCLRPPTSHLHPVAKVRGDRGLSPCSDLSPPPRNSMSPPRWLNKFI